jgi:flagellar biosynthesis protein FlhF
LALKSEIATLKQVISQFQQRPQNFLGAHPGADFGINFDLSFIFEKLIRAGIAPEIVAEMLMVAQETLPAIKLKNRPLVEAWVARQVLENTKISESLNAGKVHCFVGPAGSGKTSALIKLASRMVVEEGKKVALFTTDTYKVGASDQMKIYAQILNVPFSVIRNQNDWINLIRYISQVDCVLVDYTGLSLKNNEEVQMLRGLLPPASLSAQIHLVLSANVKDSDAADLGRRYTTVGYRDVIFTGLDESTQHGNIYNFIRRFGVPLHSFGIGPRVPDDFEFATKERLLDLIFKITNYKQQESEAV